MHVSSYQGWNTETRGMQLVTEQILYNLAGGVVYVTRFAKRGLIHAQFQDKLFITIC